MVLLSMANLFNELNWTYYIFPFLFGFAGYKHGVYFKYSFLQDNKKQMTYLGLSLLIIFYFLSPTLRLSYLGSIIMFSGGMYLKQKTSINLFIK